MSKIVELKEKRMNLVNQAREILDVAEKEKRSLAADEEEKYNRIEKDIDSLGATIQREERLSSVEQELEQREEVRSKSIPNQEQRQKKNLRESEEYRSAFWQAFRQGKNSLSADELRNLMNPEVRAMAVGTDAAGGYLVPDEFERQLIQELESANVMRGLATVITTSNGVREIPIETGYGTATWTGEGAAYTESDVAFGQSTLSAYKLTTLIKVSEEILNDSVFNVDSYVRSTFAKRFGNAEETAFVNGDGVNKPTGIVGSATQGKVGAAGQTTSVTTDDIIDTFHGLKRPYRRNGSWLLSDATVKAIRKLKDADGQYIWQAGITAGQPDRILNKPVHVSDDVPTMAASAKSILFGDFSYYWIADRQGRVMQRLDERYADTGHVGFRMYQRVDGKLILPEAVVYYQNSAT